MLSDIEIRNALKLHKAICIERSECMYYCNCRFNHAFSIDIFGIDIQSEWCRLCNQDYGDKLILETNDELKELDVPLQAYSISMYGAVSIVCSNGHTIICDIDEIPNSCKECVEISNMTFSDIHTDGTEPILEPLSDLSGNSMSNCDIYENIDIADYNSDCYSNHSYNSDISDKSEFDRYTIGAFSKGDDSASDDDLIAACVDVSEHGFDSRYDAMFKYEKNQPNISNNLRDSYIPNNSRIKRTIREINEEFYHKQTSDEFSDTACFKFTDPEFSKLTAVKRSYKKNNQSPDIQSPAITTMSKQISYITDFSRKIYRIRDNNNIIYTSVYCSACDLLQNITQSVQTHNKYHSASVKVNTLCIDYNSFAK